MEFPKRGKIFRSDWNSTNFGTPFHALGETRFGPNRPAVDMKGNGGDDFWIRASSDPDQG